ncbi:hypothetical protein BOX15_Mlig002658g1, partial [Macrostomum lignano]
QQQPQQQPQQPQQQPQQPQQRPQQPQQRPQQPQQQVQTQPSQLSPQQDLQRVEVFQLQQRRILQHLLQQQQPQQSVQLLLRNNEISRGMLLRCLSGSSVIYVCLSCRQVSDGPPAALWHSSVSNAGHYCLTLPSGWVDLASLRLTCHTCTDSWESNLSMGSLASLIVHAFSAHPITTSGPLLCVRNIASGESCLLTGDCMARCLLYNKLFCLARRNSVVTGVRHCPV